MHKKRLVFSTHRTTEHDRKKTVFTRKYDLFPLLLPFSLPLGKERNGQYPSPFPSEKGRIGPFDSLPDLPKACKICRRRFFPLSLKRHGRPPRTLPASLQKARQTAAHSPRYSQRRAWQTATRSSLPSRQQAKPPAARPFGGGTGGCFFFYLLLFLLFSIGKTGAKLTFRRDRLRSPSRNRRVFRSYDSSRRAPPSLPPPQERSSAP